MNPSRWPRLFGRGGTRVQLLLIMGWLAIGAPGEAASQAPSLLQLQQGYNASLLDLEARTGRWNEQQTLWLSAIENSRVAGLSGVRGRQEAADQAAWAAAEELTRLVGQVEVAKRDLKTKRDALAAGLQREIDLLSRSLTTVAVAERRSLVNRIDGLTQEMETLQAEASSDAQSQLLVYLPDMGLDIDPRMDFEAIRASVQLLERRITQYRADFERVNKELADLQASLRRQRSNQDAATSLGRFGASDPVGASRPRPTGSDAGTQALTLPQRIEKLTTHRNQLDQMLRQLDQRVASIKDRVPQLRGGLR